MSFSLLAVRTGEEPETSLYPDPGDEKDSVELEDGDGYILTYGVSAIRVTVVPNGVRPRQIAHFSDISARVVVTDRRVALACTKYDKGRHMTGFNLGGVAVAVTANAVSRARAAQRRKGKTLVGHVRYDWLGVIEAKDRTGLLSANTLDLLLANPVGADGTVILHLTLDKRTPATPIAAAIAHRAAAYKAAHNADTEHRPALTAYAQHPTYETHDGTVRYRLPASVA